MPREDCDVAQQDTEEDADDVEDPPSDLPCGGANLQTDNQHCGECGNECIVWYEGTDLEAGTCAEGQCGPTWTECDSGFETCAERCASTGQTCNEGGCAEVSGLIIDVPGFDACNVLLHSKTSILECDDLISWEPSDASDIREAVCCCDLP